MLEVTRRGTAPADAPLKVTWRGVGPAGGVLQVTWRGAAPADAVLEVTWRGAAPADAPLKVTWWGEEPADAVLEVTWRGECLHGWRVFRRMGTSVKSLAFFFFFFRRICRRSHATLWPTVEPLKSPNDVELWLATRYCPPVELRIELLGVNKQEAEDEFAACQARVNEAFARASVKP